MVNVIIIKPISNLMNGCDIYKYLFLIIRRSKNNGCAQDSGEIMVM